MKRAPFTLLASLFTTTTLAMALTSGTVHAAKEVGLGVTYDPRVPLGSFRDFVPDVAVIGIQAKWDYFVLDALSIGLEAQHHRFRRGVETDTIPIPNGAVTAPTFRNVTI